MLKLQNKHCLHHCQSSGHSQSTHSAKLGGDVRIPPERTTHAVEQHHQNPNYKSYANAQYATKLSRRSLSHLHTGKLWCTKWSWVFACFKRSVSITGAHTQACAGVLVFSSLCSPLASGCSQGQVAWQSGSRASHGGITETFFPLKHKSDKISSIITGGRTSSWNARGPNLELAIAFTASSSCWTTIYL